MKYHILDDTPTFFKVGDNHYHHPGCKLKSTFYVPDLLVLQISSNVWILLVRVSS